MLLALRGWDAAMLRDARPDFLAAARFALYSERLMPLYASLKDIQNRPMPHKNPAAFAELGRAKLEVKKAIPPLRAVLFPEDE